MQTHVKKKKKKQEIEHKHFFGKIEINRNIHQRN